MQLSCPNCGEDITAENINIQQMAAVCANCATVFQFALPESKTKRRKIKQPDRLTLRETEDHLHMAFRTNFRLDRNEAFISSAILSLLFTFVSLIFTGKYLADDIPLLLPIGFGLVTLFLYYWLALTVYNNTHIEMDDEKIRVSRQPIPHIFNQVNEVSLSGIVAIRHEETPISKKEGYDTPRYRVWAERADGSRQMIVNDVVEDYGLFIAQRLDETLNLDEDPDASRLRDDEQELEDGPGLDAIRQTSQTDGH